MKRLVVRCVTAAFVAGSAAIGFAPIAAASTSFTFAPTAEAWYQPNPTCQTPAGCITTGSLPVAPPVALPALPSPYPAGTLHVGFAAGQETARSYLAFPLGQLASMTVTDASLTVPLDVAQADGSVSPETAKIVVCLTDAQLAASEGTIDTPPTADCGTSAPVSYVATPQPHLKADLSSLAAGLPAATGLVLLPDASKVAKTDAPWRVVFSAHTRTDAAKTAPASLSLTAEDLPSDQPLPVVNEPGVQVPPVVAPVTGTGFAPPPVTQTITSPTVQAPAPVAAAPVAAAPRMITVGYAYPTVWLLPLACLILIPAAARALTKDLSPAS
jgi:hypothetical protein